MREVNTHTIVSEAKKALADIEHDIWWANRQALAAAIVRLEQTALSKEEDRR